MSLYLAIEIDNDTKKLLSEKQVYLKQHASGEFEDPTRFHITLRFLSENEEQNELAMKALKLFEQIYNPKSFEITAKNFCRFPQGVSWIGVHNSLNLYQMKYQIEDCLEKVGFPLKKDKHKGYTPHITMGYNVEEKDSLIKEFEGIPMKVTNISLWNGFKCNDKYIHNKLYGINLKDESL